MNRDVRGGLSLLCFAGICGLVFALGRPDDEAYFADVTTANRIAEVLGTIGALFAIGGLILIAKGLLADRR